MAEPPEPAEAEAPAPSFLRRVFSARPRVPLVQQMSATECGAACLAMVLGFYGRPVPLDDVREVCGGSRDGTTAFALLDAANHFGLRGRGVKIDLDAIEYLEAGAILHWEFDHYVVFERLRKHSVDIVDPALGRRRISRAQFGESFTGVVLVLEPGERFTLAPPRKSRLWATTREVLGRSGLLPPILTMSLLLQLFALGTPLLLGLLIDRVVPRSDHQLLTILLGGLGALVVFEAVTSLVRAHLLLNLRTVIDARMTTGFLDHLVSLPYAYFQLRPPGDLLMRLNSNSTVREILTSSALSGILDGGLVIVYVALLFFVSPTLALTALAAGIATVAVIFVGAGRQRELTAQSLALEAKSQAYEVEMLTAMTTLKAMGAEQRAVGKWSSLFVDVLNLSLVRGRLGAALEALSGVVHMGGPLVILAVGAHLVLAHQLSLGTMLAASALAGSFLGPLSALAESGLQLRLVGGYLDRINDVLDTAPEQTAQAAHRVLRIAGAIALENVSFRYGPLAPRVVEDVSLSIAPGQFVAIVGRSGAGKSTLAALLLGLYRPETGRIVYDGVDLAELDLRALRQQLGVVTQQHDVFGASIRDNIALSDPALPLDAIVEAAKLAGLHEDIMAMPLGYQTPLIERGGSISGGQRQRLALARALVRQPVILLLDEATSSLDAVTEAEVQRSLAGLACTRIVIAHRLSTVVRADLLLVMDAGRLVEADTHEALLAANGVYAELVRAQTSATQSD
jgi:ABC-type bacteriocin/lantibiotic exporter with double-glycine peptidase domain